MVVVILGVSLGIMVGISSLVLRQMRTVAGLGNSVVALHAADTGIERLIYEMRKEGYSFSCSPPCKIDDIVWDSFDDSEIDYEVYYQSADPLVIRSIGQYRQTRRAIEVTF